jgi:hypothetical protein
MRELTEILDLSHEASVRLTLESAGIEAVFQRAPHLSRGFPYARCFVVNDADYARASALVATLQRTSIADEPASRRLVIFRWAAAIILSAWFLFVIWFQFFRG